MIERIQARRDALARDFAAAKRQYEELDRQICMLAGGLAELNALLDAATDDRDDLIVRLREERDRLMSHLGAAHETIDMAEGDTISTYETGLNGAHAATLEGDS